MALNVDRDPMAVPVNGEVLATPLGAARLPQTESSLPPIANPAPLGLAALAVTTLVFSLFTTGILPDGAEPVVLPLALVYGGIVQLMAGMWELRQGNSFGALTFGSYGSFWVTYWVLEQFTVKQLAAIDAAHAVGVFMLVWALFTVSLWIVSLRTTAAVSSMLLVLTVSLLLLGIGVYGDYPDLIRIGGGFGLATAVAAWYAAFAGLLNSVFGRTLLPLVPLRAGR